MCGAFLCVLCVVCVLCCVVLCWGRLADLGVLLGLAVLGVCVWGSTVS